MERAKASSSSSRLRFNSASLRSIMACSLRSSSRSKTPSPASARADRTLSTSEMRLGGAGLEPEPLLLLQIGGVSNQGFSVLTLKRLCMEGEGECVRLGLWMEGRCVDSGEFVLPSLSSSSWIPRALASCCSSSWISVRRASFRFAVLRTELTSSCRRQSCKRAFRVSMVMGSVMAKNDEGREEKKGG